MYKIYATNIYNNPVRDDAGEVVDITTDSSYKLIFTDRPTLDFVNALKPKLIVEDNSAGSLTFTLPYNHSARDYIKLRRSYISVVKDSNEKYFERILPEGYELLEHVEGWYRYQIPVDWYVNNQIHLHGTEPYSRIEASVSFNSSPPNAEGGDYIEVHNHLGLYFGGVYRQINPQETVVVKCGATRYSNYARYISTRVLDDSANEDFRMASAKNSSFVGDGYMRARRKGVTMSSVDSSELLHQDLEVTVQDTECYVGSLRIPTLTDGRIEGPISTYIEVDSNGAMTFKGLKFYKNDELLKDIVPCQKPDGSIILYDIINNTEFVDTLNLPTKPPIPGPKKSQGVKLVKPFWVGRAVMSSVDFNKSVTFTCTGLLDCFADHITRSLNSNNY